MVRNHGSVSLAYLRGERKIKPRHKIYDLSSLSSDDESKIRALSRKTGRTFQDCAAEVLGGQTNLEEYKK